MQGWRLTAKIEGHPHRQRKQANKQISDNSKLHTKNQQHWHLWARHWQWRGFVLQVMMSRSSKGRSDREVALMQCSSGADAASAEQGWGMGMAVTHLLLCSSWIGGL